MNLPLIGSVHVAPLPACAPAATILGADSPDELKPVVDLLTQTRKSLTLRSLFMTGFPHDPEFFAVGVALARQWSRQGLKIAVVDLDYRNPTIVRPYSSEGYVDALEYGCSFQRIAWELVADGLWLVGPGSHPPDEQRFAEHPDWARVMRIFSTRVDVAIYMAPFLDRKGFTGSLSKRMDGVLLASCVRRSSRAALRDAFLELWGSDAPMIGCIGTDVLFDPVPRGELILPAEAAAPPALGISAARTPAPGMAALGTPAPGTPAAAPVVPGATGWTFPSPEIQAPRSPSSPARAAAIDRAPSPSRAPLPSRAASRDSSDTASQALVSRLSDEVRKGHVARAAPSRGRGLLLTAIALALAGAAALVTYEAAHRGSSHASAPAETLPAGTERVLPADVGTTGAAALPITGLGAAGSSDAASSDAGASTLGHEPAPQQASGDAPQATEPEPQSASPDPAAPAPPPVTKTPETRGGLTYEVHVASFKKDGEARDLVKRLHGRGLDAWYAKATDQRNWYRVFIGHYATHEEAARRATSLLHRGLVEHAIAFPDHAR